MISDFDRRQTDVFLKLWMGYALNSDDQLWLLNILETFRVGDDASKRTLLKLLKGHSHSRKERVHFWVAIDYLSRKPGKKSKGEVADRWGFTVHNVEKIVQRQMSKHDYETLKRMYDGPGTSAMVESYRTALTK